MNLQLSQCAPPKSYDPAFYRVCSRCLGPFRMLVFSRLGIGYLSWEVCRTTASTSAFSPSSILMVEHIETISYFSTSNCPEGSDTKQLSLPSLSFVGAGYRLSRDLWPYSVRSSCRVAVSQIFIETPAYDAAASCLTSGLKAATSAPVDLSTFMTPTMAPFIAARSFNSGSP